jgi:hypothetical protein
MWRLVFDALTPPAITALLLPCKSCLAFALLTA